MKQITRRELIAASTGVAGFTFLPARVLGRGGAIPPSEKLNLAFVGIGARGTLDLRELAHLDQNVVALCDVDWRPRDTAGRGGRAGKAGAMPQAYSQVQLLGQYPQAKKYDDWRRMLQEEQKNIDGVVVATPDHHHAPVSLTAMKMAKHVYVEKPMCHSIEEARIMMAFEKKYKVTTQTGNQGHSSEDCRNVVEWVRDGAIGDVKLVHLFRRQFAGGGAAPGGLAVTYENVPKLLAEDHPVPENLLWDLWLGPAKFRPFNPVYVPGRWRAWLDFGTGNPGDYLIHIFDPVAWALELGYPNRVEADPEPGYDWATNKQLHPWSGQMRWDFPARGKKPPVTVYYHYGEFNETIPRPPGWKEGEDKFNSIGGVLYGSKGAITFGAIHAADPLKASTGGYTTVNSYGVPERLRIFPPELDKEYKRPAPSLPRPLNHWSDWVESAKAGQPAGSHFGYGGVITEMALMGVVASTQRGKILEYDTKAGRFKNNDEANKLIFVKGSYRDGWALPV
ncbi:MAG: Gfo/Idh/MocA family oxidoreductase [Bryobacteraceae bacterium]|jgi:predicted dehydrogenase